MTVHPSGGLTKLVSDAYTGRFWAPLFCRRSESAAVVAVLHCYTTAVTPASGPGVHLRSSG